MAAAPPAPDPVEALRLHRALLDGDPAAPADVAVAFLEPLVQWLSARNDRAIDPDFLNEAADTAVLSLIHHPAAYDPARQALHVYLRMAAQADLKNILRREAKHRTGRRSLKAVALSPEGGKYLGRDDDPSLRLRIAEERPDDLEALPASVRAGLSEGELRALTLLLAGERKNDAYAEVLGLMHLPRQQRDREVKRVKDRLKKRRKRARRADE